MQRRIQRALLHLEHVLRGLLDVLGDSASITIGVK